MKKTHVLMASLVVVLVVALSGVSSASMDVSNPLNLLQGKAIASNCSFQDGGIWKVVNGFGDFSHLGTANASWYPDNAQAITGLDGSAIRSIRVWCDPFTAAAPRLPGDPWYQHLRDISGFSFKSSTTDWAANPLGGTYETDLGDHALPLAVSTGVLPAGWTSVGANDDPPWLYYYDINVNAPVGTKSLWFHMNAPSPTGGQYAQDLNEIQAFVVGTQIISQANGDWANGPTWDLNPTTPINPPTTWNVVVRHNVSYAATGQTVASLTLDNASSNMTIPVGKDLTASGAEVKNGALTVNGALNSNLTVSGGTATLAAGSTGTVPTLNVTGGTANVNGGSTGTTVNASGGETNLSTNVAALNISGTALVNGGAGGGATTLNVSGGGVGPIKALTLGLVASDLSVTTNATISGTGTVNTQNSYLLVGQKLNMAGGASITTTGPAFGVKGSAITSGIGSIETLKLNGGTGTVSIYSPVPDTISLLDNFGPTLVANSSTWTDQSLTLNAASKVLVVDISTRGSGDIIKPSGVSYGGTALTLAKEQGVYTSKNFISSSIWYLFNPPTGASNTLGVTLPAGMIDYAVDAFTLGGVDTTKNPELIPGFTAGMSTAVNAPGVVTLNNLTAGCAVVTDQTVRKGSAGIAYVTTNGTLSNVWTGDQTSIYSAGELVLGLTAGSATITGTPVLAVRQSIAAAVFSPFLFPGPISMATTTVELTADTWLDLGGAPDADFFDLIPMCPDGTILRIQGTNPTTAYALASFFDLTAPSANKWIRIVEDGIDGSNYFAVLKYQGTAVPEPAGLGFIGLALLALRKRRS